MNTSIVAEVRPATTVALAAPTINPILAALFDNPAEDADSYKACHWMTYPPGTEYVELYLESRGGHYDRTVFFGLQYILKAYLSTPITHAHVDELAERFAWHGVSFNAEGWHRMVDKHKGRLPLRIRAVREGQVVPTHNALMVLTNTDPEFYWLPAYFAEPVLIRVWYPTVVATRSWDVKQYLRALLHKTCENAEAELPFKLHDFGSRGATCREQAAIGGMAHLVSFRGTDTFIALKAAELVYKAKKPGFSINATEHSSIIPWGKTHEFDAYRNVIRRLAKPGAPFACVSDSYDIYTACRDGWAGALKDELIASGATLVVRPDSGDPLEVVPKCLDILAEGFGYTVNRLGYKVLKHVRLIQGDGMTPETILGLATRVMELGYSLENLAYGMGGGLLQKDTDRDTQKVAIKCCAITINGEVHEVFKAPSTDKTKWSKAGRQTLLRHRETAEFRTAHPDEAGKDGWVDVMHTVFENGVVTREWTFEDVQNRADVRIL